MYGIYFAAQRARVARHVRPRSAVRNAPATCISSSASPCSAYSAASRSIYPSCIPTRLRSTGSGFCYNIGRVVTAGGVFAVGTIAQSRQGRSGDHPAHAVHHRLRADRRLAAAALGHRDARPEDARLNLTAAGRPATESGQWSDRRRCRIALEAASCRSRADERCRPRMRSTRYRALRMCIDACFRA